MTSTAHQPILTRQKDLRSAVFSYDLPRGSGLFCGTVQAQNSFGGYGDEVYYRFCNRGKLQKLLEID